MRLVLGLQLVQGPKQLAGLAGIVADAFAFLDQGQLTLLVAAAVADGLLGLVEQPLAGGTGHNLRTQRAGGWFDGGLSRRLRAWDQDRTKLPLGDAARAGHRSAARIKSGVRALTGAAREPMAIGPCPLIARAAPQEGLP